MTYDPKPEKLIDSWIALSRTVRDTPEWDALFWSEVELSKLAREDPDSAWHLIREILKRDQSAAVVGSLSSGVLEELLSEHGDEIIDLIEKEAETNPIFAHLLGGVWQGDMSDDIWLRVQRAASARW
jgi:hypothetical protein